MDTSRNRKLKFSVEKITYDKGEFAFFLGIARNYNRELYLTIALFRWQFCIGFMYVPTIIKASKVERID